jgi:hypothetical protein
MGIQNIRATREYEPTGAPASVLDMYATGMDGVGTVGLLINPIISFLGNTYDSFNANKNPDVSNYSREADLAAKEAMKNAIEKDKQEYRESIENFMLELGMEKARSEMDWNQLNNDQNYRKSYLEILLMNKELRSRGKKNDGKINLTISPQFKQEGSDIQFKPEIDNRSTGGSITNGSYNEKYEFGRPFGLTPSYETWLQEMMKRKSATR